MNPTKSKRDYSYLDENKERNKERGGDVHVGVKTCCECGIEKERTEFHKNLRNKDGISYKCKECQSKGHKKYYNNNTDKISIRMKFQRIKKKYGLTKDGYYKLIDEQNNLCVICKLSLDGVKVDVDHDHKTGKVRGILCTNCNSMLAQAKDDIDILISGIKYLRERR